MRYVNSNDLSGQYSIRKMTKSNGPIIRNPYPVSGPNKHIMIPYAMPTKTGTAFGGIEVFGLVDAKIHIHKNPVPKASIAVA